MVAALGSGRCHVWNLRTGDCYSLRLPSTKTAEVLAVSGETLAYVQVIGRHEANSRAEVVTWTLKDQRTLSFSMPIAWKDGVSGVNAMLDKRGESLVLFMDTPKYYPEVGPAHFYCIRTSLDGNIVTEGDIEVPDLEDYQSYSTVSEKVLKEANGQAVIWSFAKHHHEEDDISTLMLICYNFQEDRLEVRKQIVTDFGSNRTDMVYSLEFHWKDAGYFLECDNHHHNLMVIDLENSTCSKAKMDFPIDDPILKEMNWPRDLRFGDETFLICVSPEEFCVWCFDANVQLSNEVIAYKEQRKSNLDRLLLLKRDGKESSSDDSVTRELD